MNLMNILWQISFISMILAFGVELGLSFGLGRYNKKMFSIFMLVTAIGTVIFTKILSIFSESVKTLFQTNVLLIYSIMALIMIIIAVKIIIDYKKNRTSFKLNMIANIAIIACCMILVALNVIFIAPTIQMTADLLNVYSTMLLVVIMIITYLISKLVKSNSKEYPVLLSDYLLMFGEYFIFSAVFFTYFPLAIQKTSNITINSVEHMVSLVFALVTLIILGIALNTKNNLLR